MAKSTKDYEADGAQMFRIGGGRPEGSSWQAKAMQWGYDEAKAASEPFVAGGGVPVLTLPFETLGVALPTLSQHPAAIHIRFLSDQVEKEDNPKRLKRLNVKAVKLFVKWKSKGLGNIFV